MLCLYEASLREFARYSASMHEMKSIDTFIDKSI